MPDPVTTAEVEDVLSSIRRLVSEEKRPGQQVKAQAVPVPEEVAQEQTVPDEPVQEQPAQEQPVAAPADPDRLVLTPALRVEDPAEAASQNKDEDWPEEDTADLDTQQQVAFRSDRAREAGTETVKPEPTPAPEPTPEQAPVPANDVHVLTTAEADAAIDVDAGKDIAEVMAEAEASEPFKFNDEYEEEEGDLAPLTLLPSARSDADWAADALAESEAVAESTRKPDGDGLADTKAATLSAKIEALESAIGGIEDDFEPDEVGSDAYSGTRGSAMAWEEELSDLDASNGALTDVSGDIDDAAEEIETAVERAPVKLEAVVVEDVVTEDDDVADDIEDDIVTNIAQEAVDQIKDPIEEAAVVAAAAAAAVAVAEAKKDQPFNLTGDDNLIDEDALRDMVGDIVRSELQGALGERITRNVRKLVRREIHRAINAQDFQ